MRLIYKYPLETQAEGTDYNLWSGPRTAEMPPNAKIIHVGFDPDEVLCVWAEVGVESKNATRRFHVAWTGQPAPIGAAYVGTVIRRRYVLHVYDEHHGL